MTQPPIAAHTARFTAQNSKITPDGRMFARVFLRNFPPVLAALTPFLGSGRGSVLEIGCGTGQHAAGFALGFPHLEWWASDPDSAHRASAAAWQRELEAPERTLDVDGAAWCDNPHVTNLGPLRAVLAMNVVHIAPFAVTKGIITGAARHLERGGLLIFYGPFMENGGHTGDGNARFHAGLQADNPAWGLRDIAELAHLGAQAGLHHAATIAMPANNRLLILRRED